MWGKNKLYELGQDLLKRKLYLNASVLPTLLSLMLMPLFFIFSVYWKVSYLEQSKIELCTYKTYFIRKVIVCFKLINPHSIPGGVEHITKVKNLKLRYINNFILLHWSKMAKSSAKTLHMQFFFNARVINLRVVEYFN